MRGVSDYAVIYDLTSNKERRKVDKLLKGYGFREQKSVFECKLNKKGKEELIQKLNQLQIKSGFIKIYRLEFSFKSPIIGKREEGIDSGYAFIV